MERSRGSVKGSGAATAQSGGVAVSGVHFGDNYLVTAPIARSAYAQQVRRIAPEPFVGRQQELEELAAFCSCETGPAWMWWQAPAWSGKSALMATFVLHPPPGIRIVSFFITARLYTNSDRSAFLDVMVEQLAEVAQRPIPAFLTDSTREAHFLDLLEQASGACQSAGERLVLVVDGLDEDRGVTSDPDSRSIAALLPRRLPLGVRVIVAGRGNPPVPLDVPEDHPLRDRSIVRPLSRSPAATVVRDQATREIRRLLQGTSAERRLLGLVAVAGGGLSSRDLAELTGLTAWEITDQLETVSGRTFTQGESRWTNVPLYELAHKELQVIAIQRLGADHLAAYRVGIHNWAEDYRRRGWPADTPEYLLRGYFSMLRASRDLARMTSFCLDDIRQNRLMELSGGDHISLAEIATTIESIRNSGTPDLLAVCRLAIRRDRIQQRSSTIPAMLPTLWATLGDIDRGEALGRSITDPFQQVIALAELAEHSAKSGDVDRGRALLEAKFNLQEVTYSFNKVPALNSLVLSAVRVDPCFGRKLIGKALNIARSMPKSSDRDSLIAGLASVMIEVGDLRDAETLIRSISESRQQGLPLAELGLAMVRNGELIRARELADEAELIARTNSDPEALLTLAVIATELGHQNRERSLAEEAEAVARSRINDGQKAWHLSMLADTIADAGYLDRAREIVEEAEALSQYISKPYEYADAVTDLASAVLKIGDLSHAETLIRSIAEPGRQASPLAELGLAMARNGDLTRARELAEEAEAIARSHHDPYEQVVTLVKLAAVVARAGGPDRARRLDEAAGIFTRAIADADVRAGILAEMAKIAASAGDLDRGRELAEEAETAARLITITDHQDWTRRELVSVMTQIGDLQRAETFARSIVDAYERAESLTALAREAARAGDLSFARDIAARVERLVPLIDIFHMKEWALGDLAGALGEAHDWERAETVARSITDPTKQSSAFAELSQVAADAGDLVHAEALVRSIVQPHARAVALADLAAFVLATGEPHRARELAEAAEYIAESIPGHGPQANIWADLAGVWADADADALPRAHMLVEKSEAATRSITDPDCQERIRAKLSSIMVQVDDLGHAEVIARSITDSHYQTEALAAVAAKAIDVDIDRAESLAASISDPDERAEALTSMAITSTPDRAQRYILTALSIAEWTISLEALGKISPATLHEIADEFISDIEGQPSVEK